MTKAEIGQRVSGSLRTLSMGPRGLAALAASGIIQPYGPATLGRLAHTLARWGSGPAGGYRTLAVRYPDEVGLVDERGALTFGDIDRRSNAIADSLAALGVREGDHVAVMCRNHRGFVDATVGAGKLGADVLYLNTAFAAPQIAEVLQREEPRAVVYDEEFTELIDKSETDALRIVAWCDSDEVTHETLDRLAERGSQADRPVPGRQGRTVILTSGTTGTPKGATRGEGGQFGAAVALLSTIPLRHRWTCHIAAPLFHTWGWAHMQLGMLLGSTIVLRRRFDPEDCLAVTQQHACDSLAVIPVMMQRIMELPKEVRSAYTLDSVKVVAASGSALPGDLAESWMDEFGDTLYNIYGSTEVAWATIASPGDLRLAPGTAGRPPMGTVVRLYDDEGKPVPEGEPGRIFVGNSMLFEGYTGGGSKDEIDGLMATGDIGRFDDHGRMFIEGRDDEMIVSGGENVYPAEVEDCLVRHPEVVEAAAIGVEDEKFGQRLRAFVVVRNRDSISEDDLREHVKSHLARYKVPRDVAFLDELPRNATGKVLKRDLDTD
ncbi:MAG TPA: AMP-binding protein [Nocardioidaceae bacterium]|nr:AMP-binding protein [Nocardioidaceae bacterium]